MVFETPVTNDVGVNTCMPLAVTPWNTALPWRAAPGSFSCHSSVKSVLLIAAGAIFGSSRSQPVRCASAPVAGHSKPTLRPCAIRTPPEAATRRATRELRVICIVFLSASHAENVDRAIECRQVGPAVGHRHPAVVVPRGDLIAAVPELFARQRIQRVERRLAANQPPRCAVANGAAKLRALRIVE